MGNACTVLAGKPNEKRRLGSADIDGILILKLILEGYGVKCGVGSCGLAYGPMAASCIDGT
jgi:hypothetical protein